MDYCCSWILCGLFFNGVSYLAYMAVGPKFGFHISSRRLQQQAAQTAVKRNKNFSIMLLYSNPYLYGH